MGDCRTALARSQFGPLRRITAVESVKWYNGHKRVFTLSCGHKVEHLQRHELHVGKMTGCEKCK